MLRLPNISNACAKATSFCCSAVTLAPSFILSIISFISVSFFLSCSSIVSSFFVLFLLNAFRITVACLKNLAASGDVLALLFFTFDFCLASLSISLIRDFLFRDICLSTTCITSATLDSYVSLVAFSIVLISLLASAVVTPIGRSSSLIRFFILFFAACRSFTPSRTPLSACLMALILFCTSLLERVFIVLSKDSISLS